MKNIYFRKGSFSRKLKNNSGFSLLELVVSVGVLLTLTVGGLLAYNGIINSARQAAVNSAAETVYNRAMVYETDNKPETTIHTAVDEWNESSGILPDQVAVANVVAGIGVNNEKIIVKATVLDNRSFEIRAVYGDIDSSNKIEAVRISPEYNTKNNGSSENTDDNNGEETPPVITPVAGDTILNYVCDSDYTSVFPSPVNNVKLDSSAIVKLTGEDGTEIESVGSPVSHTLKTGVEYKLTISGKFTTLQGNDCLRGVENIDDNSGVKTITWLGKNIVNVPAEIPDSVTNLNRIFYQSSLINDPDISSWNVDNITNLSQAFNGATSFDQPLNDWNTSNVTTMNNMFRGATLFNQNLNGWNTSKVTDMSNMFHSAGTFNNGEADNAHAGITPLQWDVSQVTNMSGMFQAAIGFNQNLNIWDTSNVINMSNMFYNQNLTVAPNRLGFNNGADCRDGEGSLTWDTSNVTSMASMFGLNFCFNQKINYWNTSNVTNMSGMFGVNRGFNQSINTWVDSDGKVYWDVSNVTNMAGMFATNGHIVTAFNQPLDKWDTSNVTNMERMFYTGSNPENKWYHLVSMKQDLTMWDVSKVTNHTNFTDKEDWTLRPIFN